jgi:hypothetical protein
MSQCTFQYNNKINKKGLNKRDRNYTTQNTAGRVAQVVKSLPSKHKTLSSNSGTKK